MRASNGPNGRDSSTTDRRLRARSPRPDPITGCDPISGSGLRSSLPITCVSDMRWNQRCSAQTGQLRLWDVAHRWDCISVFGWDQVVGTDRPWPKARRRAAGAGDGAAVGDGDLGQDVQDVLGAAVGGVMGVFDFVGGQGDFFAEGAGALDFHMQGRAAGFGACQVVAEFVLSHAIDLPSLSFKVGRGVIFGVGARPEVGGEMHVLCSGHGTESGLPRFTEVTGPVRWTPPGPGAAAGPGGRG